MRHSATSERPLTPRARLVLQGSAAATILSFYALNEQLLQQVPEDQLELVSRVYSGRLTQALVGYGRFHDLIEEELIRLVEVRSEALVHDVDELRQRHRLRPHQAAARVPFRTRRQFLVRMRGSNRQYRTNLLP